MVATRRLEGSSFGLEVHGLRFRENLKRARVRARMAITMSLVVFFGGLTGPAYPAIFGFDDRELYQDLEEPDLRELLGTAAGEIVCFDGTAGTGFVVDISEYVGEEPDFHVIATTAQVLYDGRSGESRGRCAFRPASAPGVLFELGDHLVGSSRLDDADKDDWAFARIEKLAYPLTSMRITFGDTHDFGSTYRLQPRAIGFAQDLQGLAVSSDCALDDKASYPSIGEYSGELGHMVIHDCDFDRASSGGPLLIRNQGAIHVIALNAGDSGDRSQPGLRGIPYDPKRNFYNFSRRFDRDLEEKLIAFASRHVHLRNPSSLVRARSDLIGNVQTQLARLGYDPGPMDGLAGRKTRDAIRAFQGALGILPTGRISEELLLLLKGK